MQVNISLRTAMIAGGALLLVLLLVGMAAGSRSAVPVAASVDAQTLGESAAAGGAGASCSLPAPTGMWNVEYFATTRFDVPAATQCEAPNRPVLSDNGATAAVLLFYAAVDRKDVTALGQATTPGYSATVHGCATIGGTHHCALAAAGNR